MKRIYQGRVTKIEILDSFSLSASHGERDGVRCRSRIALNLLAPHHPDLVYGDLKDRSRTMKKQRKKPFKLRLDLLEFVTPKDIIEEAQANNPRYKPEPSLGKTGVGYLRPASPDERQQEIVRSEAFSKRLKARAASARRLKRKKP